MRRNYIYQVLFQFISLIAPFLTTPYVSRVLNAELIGSYNYVLSYTTYFVLIANLGLSVYGQREIASIGDDLNRRTNLFKELMSIRIISYSFVFLIFFISFCLAGPNIWINRLFLIYIFSSFIDISWFFQGIEEFRITVFRGSIVKVAGVLLTFILVKQENDFYLYVCILLGTALLGNATLWRFVPKYLSADYIGISFDNIRTNLYQAMQLFIPQVSIQVYTVLDKTILGFLVGNIEVGYYSQAEKIVKIAITLLTAMGTVLMSRISNLYANKKQDEAIKRIEDSFSIVFSLALPMTAGMILVADEFIPFFLGNGYDPARSVLKILSFLCIAMGISGITGPAILIANRMNKEYTVSVVAGAVINLFLNMYLIPRYLSFGAAYSTVIAEFSVMILQCFFVREKMSIMNLARMFLKSALCSVPMILTIIYLKTIYVWNGLSCMVLVFISCIIYAITLALVNKGRIQEMLK